MKVLVDAAVWVDHFRRRNEQLVALLEAGLVVCHPYVVVEVACGTPPGRRHVIDLLSDLEATPMATHSELLGLLARRKLYGRGCGFVDLGLLASSLLADQTFLWTFDRRLDALAAELGCAYRPALSS